MDDPREGLPQGQAQVRAARARSSTAAWTLVRRRGGKYGGRTAGSAWLLIKERDDEARGTARTRTSSSDAPDSVPPADARGDRRTRGIAVGSPTRSRRRATSSGSVAPKARASKKAAAACREARRPSGPAAKVGAFDIAAPWAAARCPPIRRARARDPRRARRRRATAGSTRSSTTAIACSAASSAARLPHLSRNGKEWTDAFPGDRARPLSRAPRASPRGSTARSW